ncbi:NlpC/P60 family N-terminal domain-containing protein, partial [Desulfovibrio piger]|uniref:NlpC/P60 family N-terminal domain-containing protein n=1 Tax=Desulfovibrio piger TaxID=901 RepID=UPI0026F1F4F4
MTRSFLWTGVRLAALCSLLLLAACGGKQIPPRDGIPSPHLGTIRDMRSFPQDLTVFAQQAGADTPLLDSQAQAGQDARFNRIFFGPLDRRKTSIRKRHVESYFRKA